MSRESARTAGAPKQGRHRDLRDIYQAVHKKGKVSLSPGQPQKGAGELRGSGTGWVQTLAQEQSPASILPFVLAREKHASMQGKGSQICTLAERADRALGLRCKNQQDSRWVEGVCASQQRSQRRGYTICQEVATPESSAPPFLPLSRFFQAVLYWKL